MPSLNRLILCGRLGVDPEVRATQKGMAVANLSLGVTDSSNEGEKTNWYDVRWLTSTARRDLSSSLRDACPSTTGRPRTARSARRFSSLAKNCSFSTPSRRARRCPSQLKKKQIPLRSKDGDSATEGSYETQDHSSYSLPLVRPQLYLGRIL